MFREIGISIANRLSRPSVRIAALTLSPWPKILEAAGIHCSFHCSECLFALPLCLVSTVSAAQEQ
jgi:hypothetical protein